jgi:putative NADH-flavin reductase
MARRERSSKQRESYAAKDMAMIADRINLVLVGARGMVGEYALHYALEHPAVVRVTAIGRRTLGISHAKLNEILHPDFGDCSALAEALSHQDAAIFCLGAYTGAVPRAYTKAGFRPIDTRRTISGQSLLMACDVSTNRNLTVATL